MITGPAALDVQAASTLRCGSQLVSTGDRTFEVQQKCGEPISQQVVSSREVVNYYRQSEEVIVEEWVYGPSHGMYQYLRFVGGRLTEIQSKRGN
ncbi:hypothetical protein BZK31_09210 [Pseudomonas floridensis]|uniref:DUF2845 domain-containing protein n=1 Tax=Pseudomonas floridensis TaxID=1958950 RepID=A0A1X0N7U5_9PSED|nr:DUF2845 domain-containing protein [Pseudomonas floridensis]ORC59859.1 hypothetical protein BZK31_09210 [Pseudomonas floridensis]